MGKGGRGKGYDKGAPAGGGSHYFSNSDAVDDDSTTPAAAAASAIDKEVQKQEMKLKKKLRELEALEKRRDAGEKLEALQLKKLETKNEVEEELGQFLAKQKPAVEAAEEALPGDLVNVGVDDIQDELAELARESAELEELKKGPPRDTSGKGKGRGCRSSEAAGGKAKPSGPPSVSLRQQQALGKAGNAAGGGKGWGAPKPQGVEKWELAPSKKAAAEHRLQLPAGDDEEGYQMEQFRCDLEMWTLKFECSGTIEGKDVIARFDDPQKAGTAMTELGEIVKYNFPGAS